MSDFAIQQKIQKARIKLSKKSDGLSFFGICAYRFQWAVEDMQGKPFEGYVLFDKDSHDIEDGTIHINRDMVAKDDYTHIHLAFIICHELLHILGKHGIRKGTRKHEYWLAACDHVVERDLKSIATSIRPYDAYHYFKKLHNESPACSVEDAYDWIKKEVQNGNMQVQPIPGEGESGVQVSGDHGEFMISGEVGGVDPKKGVKPKDVDTIQTNEKIVAEARAIHQNFKSKGSSSGSLTSYLDDLLKVKIPWETLLEKAIKTNVMMKPDERSWKSPHKMFRPHGIMLPGATMVEEQDGTGIIFYGTDSSGSMGDDDLKKCSSVTEQSFQFFKEVWLYVHDMRIHQKKIFDKDDKHQFMHFIKNEGYKGRGGTEHCQVFDAVQKDLWEENGYKNDLSMAIFLTDGYSDIEREITNPKYEWLKVIPTVFVITPRGKQLNIPKECTTVSVIYMDERDEKE